MSAATAKKVPVPGGVARGGTPEPASSPARMKSATPSNASSSTPRTRSVRQAASISARGAARQSPLSSGSSGASATGGADAAAAHADQDARAEANARIQDLQEQLAAADSDKAQISKQAEVLQEKLDESLRGSARLEEKVHEIEGQLEALTLEKRETTRQIREMETMYEAERSSMNKEKEDMANKEEEMQTVIQRLKDSLAQRNGPLAAEDDARQSRQASTHTPSVNGDGFAPPSSLQRSDSRNNSKLLQKDKLIESLRLELAEAQIKLVESENQGGGRLQEVERLLMEARMANARLVEDNESYQLLLQEKTLAGDFGKSDFSYMGGGSNQDALNALEGRLSTGTTVVGASSLADELSDAAEVDGEDYRRLEAELKASKESNKALTLYINKIIERLLQHQDFEHILDQSGEGLPKPPNTNKDLPPPPAHASGATVLQRAKVMAAAGGVAAGTGTKPRPRPISFLPSQGANSAHTDPDRAPSIPIGNFTRSPSVRRTRPMSEQFTGSGAASLVSQMYHGGSGPSSPPLGPARAQTFFSPSSMNGNPNAAARHPSGHSHSASGGHSSSGNFSGMRSSDASSTTSGDSIGDVATVSSPGQSPPRAPSEKSTTFAGNKPRPLRLVQENSDCVKADTSKRGSWMPWSWGSGAIAKKEDMLGELIRE